MGKCVHDYHCQRLHVQFIMHNTQSSIKTLNQCAIREETIPRTSSRSYVRFAVVERRGRRTDRNRKGELEGGVGKFYFKHFVREIFMSKCTTNIWLPGSARTQLGSLSAP